jgi:hypothetical protein
MKNVTKNEWVAVIAGLVIIAAFPLLTSFISKDRDDRQVVNNQQAAVNQPVTEATTTSATTATQ